MALSAVGAPLVLPQGSGDSDLGVSMASGGIGLMDSRQSYKYGGASNVAYGWMGNDRVPVIDQVPSTASTTAIAASQSATSGSPMSLLTTSGTSGITVLTAPLTVYGSGNVIPAGTLVIDGNPGLVSYGTTGKIQLYNPTSSIARSLQIACNGNDSSGFYTITGWDVYGYPQTEKVTGGNAVTVTSKKAMKFIKSIVPGGTIASTSVGVGQSDVYGFPLAVSRFGNVQIYWGATSTMVTAASTGTFTFADVTNPASSTTGDVRGTWLSNSTSNATIRLQVFITPQATSILGYTGSYPSGLFGQQPA